MAHFFQHFSTWLSDIYVSAKEHPCGSAGKDSACSDGVLSLDWEEPLEKGKAIHSGILAWRIPRTI